MSAEIAPDPVEAHEDLFAGVAVACLLEMGWGIATMLLKPLLRNPSVLQVSMVRVQYPLQIVACFLQPVWWLGQNSMPG